MSAAPDRSEVQGYSFSADDCVRLAKMLQCLNDLEKAESPIYLGYQIEVRHSENCRIGWMRADLLDEWLFTADYQADDPDYREPKPDYSILKLQEGK